MPLIVTSNPHGLGRGRGWCCVLVKFFGCEIMIILFSPRLCGSLGGLEARKKFLRPCLQP